MSLSRKPNLDFRIVRATSFKSLAQHFFNHMAYESADQLADNSPFTSDRVAVQDRFKANSKKVTGKTGITENDMAEMSIAEFNQQQHDRYPDQIYYYFRIEQLCEIIPRTQAQIAEDREIAQSRVL